MELGQHINAQGFDGSEVRYCEVKVVEDPSQLGTDFKECLPGVYGIMRNERGGPVLQLISLTVNEREETDIRLGDIYMHQLEKFKELYLLSLDNRKGNV